MSGGLQGFTRSFGKCAWTPLAILQLEHFVETCLVGACVADGALLNQWKNCWTQVVIFSKVFPLSTEPKKPVRIRAGAGAEEDAAYRAEQKQYRKVATKVMTSELFRCLIHISRVAKRPMLIYYAWVLKCRGKQVTMRKASQV
jgi:hypothetical protein